MNWLITGVSSGLGEATAVAALDRGDTVVGVVRRPESAPAFEAHAPGRAIALVADMRERPAVFTAFAEAEARSGGIDILVNNAGRVLDTVVEDAELNAVRDLFEINFMGALNGVQAILPFMRARKRGRIANISSGGGILAAPAIGLYCASKFALEGMTEALRAEVGPLGILVTIVEPGSFKTELLPSRKVIASSIADYGPVVGDFRHWLDTAGDGQRGDPAKLGKAMLALADADAPPLRLALGIDAIRLAEQKAASILADIAAWRSVGSDLDAPRSR